MSFTEEQRLRDLERTLFGALPITEKESVTMSPVNEPEVSPTGTPIVSPKVVPWLAALVGAAGVAVASLPPHTIGYKIAAGIVAFGALFGVVSPGLRR